MVAGVEHPHMAIEIERLGLCLGVEAGKKQG
jgi:hypothetical protein